jgi:hypothetical protein
MKITVELPESELAEICEITGVSKKGPAIRKLLTDTLRAQRRATIAGKFLTGEWSADLDGFEATISKNPGRNHAIEECNPPQNCPEFMLQHAIQTALDPELRRRGQAKA